MLFQHVAGGVDPLYSFQAERIAVSRHIGMMPLDPYTVGGSDFLGRTGMLPRQNFENPNGVGSR